MSKMGSLYFPRNPEMDFAASAFAADNEKLFLAGNKIGEGLGRAEQRLAGRTLGESDFDKFLDFNREVAPYAAMVLQSYFGGRYQAQTAYYNQQAASHMANAMMNDRNPALSTLIKQSTLTQGLNASGFS